MKIGYARVSTKNQNYDSQVEALKSAGCEKIFFEKQSGRNTKRPELNRLLDLIRPGDVLMVTKLDRLARSVGHLITTLNHLNDLEVSFVSLGENLDLTTPQGKLQMQIVAAFAEFEAELASTRTREGLEYARSLGRIGGRKPALNEKQKNELVTRYQKGGVFLKELAGLYGIHEKTAQRILKAHRAKQNTK